jgi:hypothetical protein
MQPVACFGHARLEGALTWASMWDRIGILRLIAWNTDMFQTRWRREWDSNARFGGKESRSSRSRDLRLS